ncbi:tyrosine-protein phosphatase [Maribacter chungangensis]|uniref:protein-tyrosine-phosphatase n=1 Tax=Maribacter chungangensis TaxID=1069117 RepID=A0ABW3B8N3_9FLAO
MFDFFVKKKFLVDYLDGFTDIHNHILPGIDDGAKTVEESIVLIKGMGEIGISNFICTPHIMENYYPNNKGSIQGALTLVENALKTNDLSHVNVKAAAEHMIDSGFEALVESDSLMQISDNYILVEMSYLQASLNFEESIEKLKDKDLYPIFAHPERYAYLHHERNDYTRMKDLGMLFQLNLLSLSGYYGKDVHKKALNLLDHNLIDFVASDLHNKNHLKHLKNIQISPKVLDKILPIIARTSYNFG